MSKLAELILWSKITSNQRQEKMKTDMIQNQSVPGELNCFKGQTDQEVLRQSRSFNSSGVILKVGKWGKKKIH